MSKDSRYRSDSIVSLDLAQSLPFPMPAGSVLCLKAVRMGCFQSNPGPVATQIRAPQGCR